MICNPVVLIVKLFEYLQYGSSDGNPLRQKLRKELCELIGEKYDENKCLLDKTNQ